MPYMPPLSALAGLLLALLTAPVWRLLLAAVVAALLWLPKLRA